MLGLLLQAVLFHSGNAWAAPLLIPIRDDVRQALDLLDKSGLPLDMDQAIEAAKTQDLSLLNPDPSDSWQNQKWKKEELETEPFPASEVEVESIPVAQPRGIAMMRVQAREPKTGILIPYQFILTANLHSSLARGELLRKLGYPIPAPKHYKKLKVTFPDEASLKKFLGTVTLKTGSDSSIWLSERSAEGANPVFATFKDVALESPQLTVPQFHWGLIDAKDIQGRRNLLALPVAFSLTEIPESVNIFSWDGARVLNEHVLLETPSADAFMPSKTAALNIPSFSDAKWLVRRIAKLSLEDWTEIADAGAFPSDVARLVREKLISRRNSLIEIFGLKTDEHSLPYLKMRPNTRLTTGAVKKGKLTQSFYDDYPLRFSYDPVPSPLRMGQISRFLGIEAIGQGIGGALDFVSRKFLTARDPDDVLKKRQEDFVKSIEKHFQENPGVPYQQSVETFGGPLAGLNVSAGRDIVSGAYYGSDSPVQLVDRIGVSASIGYFMGVDGVPNVVPGFQGNVAVSRNYVHVKPLGTMKEALKSRLGDIFVPGVLNRLGKLVSGDEKLSDSETLNQIRGIFNDLREDEMLIVTDSLNYGVRAEVQIPIQAALAFLPPQISPSIGVAAGMQPQIFHRTTIVRTGEGLQIYVQGANLKNIDFEVNFKWYIKLIMAGVQHRSGEAEAKAVILRQEALNGLNSDQIDDLAIALKSLFRFNQAAPLLSKFPHYQFQHDLRATASKFQFLIWKTRNTRETHTLHATPPSGRGTRDFFSIRNTKIQGTSPWGLFGDVAAAASGGLAKFGNSGGPDPSSEFFGKSFKTQVRSEAETTPGLKTPTQVSLIDETYSGWSIKKKKVIKILKTIEDSVRSLNLDRGIFRKEIFNDTRHVQLYQISSSYTLYADGIAKIEKKILDPRSLVALKAELISAAGQKAHDRYCANHDEKFDFWVKENKKDVNLGCLEPWMQDAIRFRAKVSQKPTEAAGSPFRITAAHDLVRALFYGMDRPTFFNWIGKDQIFFQAKVTGFRTNDENEDADVYLDTIGNQERVGGLGPFRDLVERFGLSAAEVNGQYLSEGY